MVLLILGCFTICWLPYFVVACSQIYKITENSSVVAYMAAFTLAMSNSAMNPLIYAWKNSNFRQAFTNLLKCKSPDTLEPSQSMRSNLHRKSSSAQHQESLSGAFPNYSTPPFAKKTEPIASMGITFEEDEDKISTHESSAVNVKSKSLLCSTNPVTIKIESDTRRNSVIISTTTLPSSHVITMQDDPTENTTNNKSSMRPLEATIESHPHHQAYRIDEVDSSSSSSNNGALKTTGNLIINKLIENYEYDDGGGGGKHDEVVQKFRENLLNSNGTLSIMNEDSKRKSKSTNSIVITKCPNKSNSHNSIYNNNNDSCSAQLSNGGGDLLSNGKSPTKSLLTTFHFGKKYISKSFNSHVEKCSNIEKMHRKSAEIHYPA